MRKAKLELAEFISSLAAAEIGAWQSWILSQGYAHIVAQPDLFATRSAEIQQGFKSHLASFGSARASAAQGAIRGALERMPTRRTTFPSQLAYAIAGALERTNKDLAQVLREFGFDMGPEDGQPSWFAQDDDGNVSRNSDNLSANHDFRNNYLRLSDLRGREQETRDAIFVDVARQRGTQIWNNS
ncbi:hypothetical protein B7R54_07185 [Subtercola boreus]|uniref:Uncharacterized protein n=1 Tax=Subtercola boreus TaxID=120213 RepID=A0A3E0VH21_9MICO|nr:hypothetical protein B7R54_07185 [Subtercola boreus]